MITFSLCFSQILSITTRTLCIKPTIQFKGSLNPYLHQIKSQFFPNYPNLSISSETPVMDQLIPIVSKQQLSTNQFEVYGNRWGILRTTLVALTHKLDRGHLSIPSFFYFSFLLLLCEVGLVCTFLLGTSTSDPCVLFPRRMANECVGSSR